MRSSKKQIHLITLVLVLASSAAVFGQDPSTGSSTTSGTGASRTIGEGQKITTEGIVVNRDVDTFTIRDSRGKETTVGFSAKTKFRLVRKGLFRADRSSDGQRDQARPAFESGGNNKQRPDYGQAHSLRRRGSENSSGARIARGPG